MTETSSMTSLRKAIAWLTPLASLLVAASPGFAGPGTTACGTGSPAFPVPETRVVGGQVFTLWPPNGFRPAGDPTDQLPAERDSTTFVGLPSQVPGRKDGLELFTDVDVAGNYAYVAYNAGFSIWNLSGAFAADPQRISVRDGFERSFCSFEEVGEVDEIVWDIAHVADGGDETVALASIGFHTGLTVWDVSNKDAPVQLYQDRTRVGRRVEAVRFNNKAYAFFGTNDSLITSGGLHVYNLTAAKDCLATSFNSCGSTCLGVYLGEIGDWSEVQYLSVLKRTSGASERLFVAISDGTRRPRGVEIHEITDVRTGLLSSRLVFSGLHERARGLALFNYQSKAYLAVKDHLILKIFDVTACLDSNNCSTLQNDTPVWSENIGLVGNSEELVTFSQADASNPFLFFGNDNVCQRGTKKERLLDLRNLGAASPVLPDLTDGGDSYADPGHGELVDYWGSYYDRNTDGLNGVAPRVAKVRREPSNNTLYFYRAAWLIFDVHQLGGAAPPPGTPAATIAGPAEGWLGDAASFTATAQNCAGAQNWTWWFTEGGTKFNIGADDNTLTHTFPLPAAASAPPQNRSVAVGATKNACNSGETMVDANVTPRSILLKDPRPVIPGLQVTPAPGPFARGTELTFQPSGAIGGKSPFTYSWSVLDPSGAPVPDLGGTASELDWDTCNATLDGIFTDGFESGNTTRWSQLVGSPATLVAAPPATKATESATYTVKLEVTSQVGLGPLKTTRTLDVGLMPSGTPAFGNPPLTVENLQQGQFRFTANTNDLETDWRWEVEDVTGLQLCTFGAQQKGCRVFDWGQAGAQITHQWLAPNTPGTYQVQLTVRSRSCAKNEDFVVAGPVSTPVNVDEVLSPTPPVVTSFAVEEGGPASCVCDGFGAPCSCLSKQNITFIVTVEGSFSSLVFKWDDGTPAQTLTPSASNKYIHQYSTPRAGYNPTVKAVSGSLESAETRTRDRTLDIR